MKRLTENLRFCLFFFAACLYTLTLDGLVAENHRKLFAFDQTKEVLECVQKWLPQNPVIIDAGSYDGQDSILMAKWWPQGKIFAFEPVPQMFLKTRQNTASYANIACFPFALADVSEKKVLYISKTQDHIAASSSLLQPKEHLDFYPEILFPTQIEVEGVALDDWAEQQAIKHIDFLWLDMQGFELFVLKQSQLAARVSAIYTEVEFIEAYAGQYLYEDVCSWMQSQGFEMVGADFVEPPKPNQIKNRRFWGNCLFVRSALLQQV